MKTPIAIALVALASLTANAASAYSFNPPYATVHLVGKMTFTPNEGGTPFTCSVTLYLKTKKQDIIAVKFPKHGCDVHFSDLPWGVEILTANSGQIFIRGFSSGNGDCAQSVTTFQDNGSGIWTLPTGQCFSGTLKSVPPTTIVP
jgi:hypothetical protein